MSWIVADRYGKLAKQRQFQPIKIISRDSSGKGRYGIFNDLNTKIVLIQTLQIIMQERRLFRLHHIVSENPSEQVNELSHQMIRYKKEVEVPKFGDQKPKVHIHGKGAPGQYDDLMMCLQMALQLADDSVDDDN